MDKFVRSALLIGEDNINKLKNKTIMITVPTLIDILFFSITIPFHLFFFILTFV